MFMTTSVYMLNRVKRHIFAIHLLSRLKCNNPSGDTKFGINLTRISNIRTDFNKEDLLILPAREELTTLL